MVRVTWFAVAIVALVSPLAGFTPAGAADCGVGGERLIDLQNDANSGRDAPDHPAGAHLLPGESVFNGALQLPTHQAVGDPADWYAFRVSDAAEEVMIELKHLAEVDVPSEAIVADLMRPGDLVPVLTVPMGSGLITVEAVEGEWIFGVRFLEVVEEPCSSKDRLPADIVVNPLVTSYYLYLGCDPVCL
jgi:hypothetical protein